MPGVLAGAVVLEPRRRVALRAALEVVLAGVRAGEQHPHGLELLAVRPGARPRRSRAPAGRGRRTPRASGSAWNGFADERSSVTSDGSPASTTLRPSRTATAWTRCVASTTPPRRTITLMGCGHGRRTLDARATGDGGLAAPARRAGERVPDREGRAGARRDAENVRSAAVGARRPAARGRAAAGEAAAVPDRGRRARRCSCT